MRIRRIVGIGATAVLIAVSLSETRLAVVRAKKEETRGFAIVDKAGGGCDHAGDQTPVKISKGGEDKLVWYIANTCSSDQGVRLCAYRYHTSIDVDEDLDYYNPFKCSGDGDINQVFGVDSQETARVKCKGNEKGAFVKMIQVGGDISGSNCPAHIPYQRKAQRAQRMHTLDVEITP